MAQREEEEEERVSMRNGKRRKTVGVNVQKRNERKG